MNAAADRLRAFAGLPLRASLRVISFGLITWGITAQMRPGLTGAHAAVGALLVAVAPAWLAWSASFGKGRRLYAPLLAWIGAAGGVLAVFAPLALTFVGTAAFGASMEFDLPLAIGIAGVGPAALFIASLSDGRSGSFVVGGAAAALAGLVLGVSRRQMLQQTEQAALVAVERERAALEHDRSEVLAERNRLAREIHDVLAHTLGALSVQLEALITVYEANPSDSDKVREGLRRTKSLASEGLVEARRAVRALRDTSVPLAEQFGTLCARSDAEVVILGEERSVPPEAALALYRAAQESLTNAVKHAPGAHVSVRLEFEIAAVVLTVTNGPSSAGPGALAASGAGYGLQGISERIRLLGGVIQAGPVGNGWRVRARLQV